MGQPLCLVENLGSLIAFPLHGFAADEEAAGHEAARMVDGRRSAFDFWTAVTANAQRTITWTCDRLRTADTIVLDRGHNLAGVVLTLEASQDNFATPAQQIFSFALPSVAVGGDMTIAPGVVTEEGAWLFTFPDVSATYFRLRIAAMGAGKVPLVVGLWLGLSWTPGFFLTPWGEDQDAFEVKEATSEAGWLGRGAAANVRQGELLVKLPSDDAYDVARYHIQGHFGHGRPMWVVYDQQQADRAFCVLRPTGALGFRFEGNWWPRQARIPYREHEPMRAA
jgi:hypothetical protein